MQTCLISFLSTSSAVWVICYRNKEITFCLFQARPLLTRALEDEKFDGLVDRRLENDYNHNEMARMVACCAACVRHSAKRRPRMTQVKFHFTLKIKTHISIDEDSSRNELQPSTIESKLKSTMFDALVNI